MSNGLFTCSDYAFVLLNMERANFHKKCTNFKYRHFWVQYQDTHTMVKKNWNTRIQGTPIHPVTQKLKRMKLQL